MKKYVVDQALLLAIGIAIMLLIPVFCGPIFTLIFEIAVIFCWGYFCHRILLLPFDVFLGKVSQTVYFSSQCGVEDLEFHKGIHYFVWKFYFEKSQTIKLLVPIDIIEEKVHKIDMPPKDVKLIITYLRFSKISLEWNLA